MMRRILTVALLCATMAFFCATLSAQEEHDHPAPETLGTVSFPTSCQPQTQAEFDRAVALLHSFAYRAAEDAFRSVAVRDPQCAMAHWGVAMTHYHQLWDPPLSAAGITAAQKEIKQAEMFPEASAREREYIQAASLVFKDDRGVPYSRRALDYETAMRDLAAANRKDAEAQVFYALALLANASPFDKEHRKQKQAADLLEPLYREFPNHPGIPHYLIHAYDSRELASRGLPAARAYSRIAPSAPHALHMPSHIFTQLGLWEDSITSNRAARSAAHQQGDTGEELHAMDYLVYAYLQSGRDQDAAEVIEELKGLQNLNRGDFKTAYAAAAMPVRYIVERRQWSEAETIPSPPASGLPQVLAITVWARGLGSARNGHPVVAYKEAATLRELERQLRASGNSYWATQVSIMEREVMAWSAQAEKRRDEAAAILGRAADDEDGIEKLPVTPGPIVPAREQLGELLLEQGDSASAAKAFEVALANAPGRRGALQGAARASQK